MIIGVFFLLLVLACLLSAMLCVDLVVGVMFGQHVETVVAEVEGFAIGVLLLALLAIVMLAPVFMVVPMRRLRSLGRRR